MSPSDLGVEVPSGVEKIYAKILYIAGGGGGSSSGGSADIPANVLRQDNNNPYLKRSAINTLVNEKVSSFITANTVSTMLNQQTSSFITSETANNLINSQISGFVTEDVVNDKISTLSTSISETYATKSDLEQFSQTLNVSSQIEDISTRLTKLEAYLGLPSEQPENTESLQDIIASLKNRVLQLEAASGTTDMGDRLGDPQNNIVLSDREDESTTLIYGDRT